VGGSGRGRPCSPHPRPAPWRASRAGGQGRRGGRRNCAAGKCACGRAAGGRRAVLVGGRAVAAGFAECALRAFRAGGVPYRRGQSTLPS
jgi:hypothetical protein